MLRRSLLTAALAFIAWPFARKANVARDGRTYFRERPIVNSDAIHVTGAFTVPPYWDLAMVKATPAVRNPWRLRGYKRVFFWAEFGDLLPCGRRQVYFTAIDGKT